ncbi:MAG: amidohydrolase [Leptospiraceae bacterium]|nr:amidohydrolase [Leptospiraceae bacterium]
MLHQSARNTVSRIRTLLPGLFFMGCLQACSPTRPPAAVLFYNGTIITMASASPKAEAVYIQDGIIQAVGTEKDLRKLAAPDSIAVNLEGQTLLPGFIASHTHPELSAWLHSFVDLSGFKHSRPAAVWDTLHDAVHQARPGEWIFCKGFDPILVPSLQSPTIQELDKIAPQNPVIILAQSLHSAWGNTLAFEAAGITATTPDPGSGSYYEKDQQGQLTGFIAETEAMKPFTRAGLPHLDIKQNMVAVMQDYARSGFSSIVTAGVFGDDNKPLMMLRWLSAVDPGITLQIAGALGILPPRPALPRNFVYLKADTPMEIPSAPERDDPGFQIIGIKLWYDGSPYTGSMYLSEPYLDSSLMQAGLNLPPGSRGAPVLPRSKFRLLAEKYHQQGFQLAVHSQGDESSREVLSELNAILRSHPRPDHRHRIEHCLLFPPDLLQNARRNGFTLSYHINHLYYYGDALRADIIGAKRSQTMLPLASTHAAGVVFTLHADQPMYPEDPLSLMATAVNRRTRSGNESGREQAIPVQAALRALTLDAAWQIGMEKQLGSIEPGKYADFVILDRDPGTIQATDLRSLKVMATWTGGRQTWSRTALQAQGRSD